MKILVTGGNGFIGRHLCRRLLDAGHQVHATSRSVRPSSRFDPCWHQADFADLAATREVIGRVKPEVVFHLAGAVGASPELSLVLPTFHGLLASTVNLLIVTKELGCQRIILAGSSTEPSGAAETANPQAPYAAAKWAATGYGRMFHTLYDAPVVVLRPFMTYGPGQAHTKVIPSVAFDLLRRKQPKVSSGQQCADWVYISDVIDGFVAAVTARGIEGKTIDLGSGALISLRDLLNRLVLIVDNGIEPAFGALQDRPNEKMAAANTFEATRMLRWHATTPLDTGLRRTVEWCRTLYKQGFQPGF